MMNLVMFEGKIVDLPILKKTSDEKRYATIVIESTCSYENNHNHYETNQIVVIVWDGLAEKAVKKCKLGSLISIRGHIKTYQVQKDETIYYNYEIVAEHISY